MSVSAGDESGSGWDVHRLARRVFVLFGGLALAACMSISTRFVTGLSAEERALAAQLPVYDERLTDGTYGMLEPVSGLSCQVNQADNFRASEDGAIEELKRAAFRVGADAVIDVRCTRYERGQGRHSCFRAIECVGEAVRLAH